MPPIKNHLPNLDALRFFAFTAVFIAHAYHPVWDGMKMGSVILQVREKFQVGVLGVNFFFVLSGFLISRILLLDLQKENKIQLFQFYKSRIFRIWPLYFIIIILSIAYYYFFKIENTNTEWILVLLFGMNFHIIERGHPYSPSLSNLWTISIEEQFYFIWPIIISIAKKNISWMILFFLLSSIIFRMIFINNPDELYFNTLSVMNDFAMGALCTLISLNEKLLLRIKKLSRFNIGIIYLIFSFIIIFYNNLFNTPITLVLERFILSCFFGFIILEQAFTSNSFFKTEKYFILNYSGKISYGLYMYHAFALQAAGFILEKYSVLLNPVGYMLLYPVIAFFITYLISIISYEWIEKYFLKMAHKNL